MLYYIYKSYIICYIIYIYIYIYIYLYYLLYYYYIYIYIYIYIYYYLEMGKFQKKSILDTDKIFWIIYIIDTATDIFRNF